MEHPITEEAYGLETILTVDEAARFLRINPKTLYEAIHQGAFPARKIGRRVIIFRDSLLNWLTHTEECGLARQGD